MAKIGQKLKEHFEQQQVTQVELAAKLGVTKAYINALFNDKKTFGKAQAEKWSQLFGLSSSWLLTGEGTMLKPSSSSAPPQPLKNFEHGVPYYNVDFIGGFDLVDNSQSATPEYLIDYAPYNKATCWCNITGHSMEPEISHGDMLALKKVEDASFLPFGEVYAIVTTNDMRTVKRIGPASTPDAYALIPSNKSPEYGVQELPKAMIRTVFQVLGCMKRL